MLAIERCLITKQRRIFTPEFKREAACLVLDQAYSPLKRPVRLGWLRRRGNCCHDNASMKRLFCSLKTEWILTVDYMSAVLAQQNISRFLMERYN
jgi:transposase InsO family protein